MNIVRLEKFVNNVCKMALKKFLKLLNNKNEIILFKLNN